MERVAQSRRRLLYVTILSILILAGTAGCVTTRGWVYEQIIPLNRRMSDVDTRTDLALKNLENLRLEQHLVLSEQAGTNFATDSAHLTPHAQRRIDDFLHALPAMDRAIFLVASHTDSAGSEDDNDALGQKRAGSVAQYLVAAKGIHPMHITTVSFGERTPMAENTTPQGRFRNRRVEIQVYQQPTSSSPGAQRLDLERRGEHQTPHAKEVAHGRN